MEALLLAAGFGSRLGNITKTQPKCLISLGGRPLLQIWLDHLIVDLDIQGVFVNTHYLHGQVEQFLASYAYSSRVTLLYEPELYDTAGTLRANVSRFDSELLVIHADNFFTSPLNAFVESDWLHHGCSIKALTIETNTPSKFGIFDVNETSRVTRFREKPNISGKQLANAAIYRMRLSCLKLIAANVEWKNISTDVLPNMSNAIEIYRYDGEIIDIGTPEDLLRVQKLDDYSKITI